MNPRQHLLILKGKNVTTDVLTCELNPKTDRFDIQFAMDKTYSYGRESVVWLNDPKALNPSEHSMTHNGKALFDIAEIYEFSGKATTYWHLVFKNGREATFRTADLEIISSCLGNPKSRNLLSYLKETAELVSLKADDGTNLLSKQYEKLAFIDQAAAFSSYSDHSQFPPRQPDSAVPIFPFGTNASQMQAVTKALTNQVSVIQGPPGTGKTQTILTIIANLLVANKSVLLVANNNSATANVLEKLSDPKIGLGFLVAALGKGENKKAFLHGQKNSYPESISNWGSSGPTQPGLLHDVHQRSTELRGLFEKSDRLAILRARLRDLDAEFQHFEQYSIETGPVNPLRKLLERSSSSEILRVWRRWQSFLDRGRKPSLWFRLVGRWKYGLGGKGFWNDPVEVESSFQRHFYLSKRKELSQQADSLESELRGRDIDEAVAGLRELSMQQLQRVLHVRYGQKTSRVVFEEDDLWRNPKRFLEEYPVVLSTTFSARNSLSQNAKFDYVIMDEASQVDVATGALALTCAYNAVIVGDEKQLPNVITDETRSRLQRIFDTYEVNESYNFAKNSFLGSVLASLPKVPQTRLREHYRCHPKIANFFNQRFYGGDLLVMSRDEGEADVLTVYRTGPGEHARDHMNQRQIDVLRDELLPTVTFADEDIGVIAPYNNQVDAISKALSGRKIDTATVHKFQGREKELIVLSTVDNEVTSFSDDPNLLNVAVSRAQKRLVLVVSGKDQPKNSNVGDLIDYVNYHNFTVTESATRSVFDFLYQHYAEARREYLAKHKRISEYDSENLMYALIIEILQEKSFERLSVVCHQPLNMLIRDFSRLTDDEARYARNRATHLDFLIYHRVSKRPVLAIEVDGFHFHKKGTTQSVRDQKKDHILELYGIDYLRFVTNGSGEKERLVERLTRLLSMDW